jgi:hypothetical protein
MPSSAMNHIKTFSITAETFFFAAASLARLMNQQQWGIGFHQSRRKKCFS